MAKKFETLEVALTLIHELVALVATLKQHDRDLALQLTRAASSVPLNIAEGARRNGRDRLHAFRIAAGSAAEVQAALSVAHAWGYVNEAQFAKVHGLTDRVLAMLYRLTHPKR